MINLTKKSEYLFIVVFIIILLTGGAYFVYKENASLKEELSGQQKTINEMRASQNMKLTSLVEENDQQKTELEKLNNLNFEEAKSECESRLKKSQDNLASTQWHLGDDTKVLKLAENDTCKDCYTACLKSYRCDKSSCEDSTKKQCKKNHEENIKFRKQDVSDDTESIAKQEKSLADLKLECKDLIEIN